MNQNIIKLYDYFRTLTKQSVCVAFSGGVDSSLLLKAACDTAKENGTTVFAITFDTKLHPKADLFNAQQIAQALGAVHHVIQVDELTIPALQTNPVDRCYLCKHHLFETALQFAKEKDISILIEGTNADDLHEYRPGIRAIRELGVISPLADLVLTKEQVRACAADLGLAVASRPSSPCLATRLPYGTEISYELLARIDEAEEALKAMGFAVVRIRVHGDIARIEIPMDKMPEFMAQREKIIEMLKSKGFMYLTLDLEGFRSGSMDIHVRSASC